MKRVLLVEDDQDVREAVCETLEDVGFAVSTAANGLLALGALAAANELPGLILLDLTMPVMNGEHFLRELRKNPRLSALHVVLFTANGHAVAEPVRLGADHGLRKPVQLHDLVATVSKYCGDR